MPIAEKIVEPCPRCGADNDVWAFEKDEGSGIKRCYTCRACGCEWTELKG